MVRTEFCRRLAVVSQRGRPSRASQPAGHDALAAEVAAGRLDDTSVAAVLSAAGQPARRRERPAGLTEREMRVVVLLARGPQTKTDPPPRSSTAGALNVSLFA